MAVTATGSKFSKNNMLILAVVCIGFGLWFAYDGWVNEEYKNKETNAETGEPTPNLQFNRYVPIPLAVIAVYALVMTARIPKRRVVADEKGLTVDSGLSIAYGSVRAIDKRNFEKDGHFTIQYEVNGVEKSLKLSERKYDNLGVLLDEVVRQTGAAPADSADNGGDAVKQS